MNTLVSLAALLSRLVRPARGVHAGPGLGRPDIVSERRARVRVYVPIPVVAAEAAATERAAAMVRPYYLAHERRVVAPGEAMAA